MAQAAERRGKGFDKDSGIPSLESLEAKTVQGLSELMSAPKVAIQLRKRFGAAKKESSREKINEVKKEISPFLDRTQETVAGLESMITSLKEGDAQREAWQKMIDMFDDSSEDLFDLEEEIGTWLEEN